MHASLSTGYAFKWCAGVLLVLALHEYAGAAAPAVESAIETVTQSVSPAGPTTRHEWRTSERSLPVRIQLEYVRAGAVVVGGARLVHERDGAWAIVTSDQHKVRIGVTRHVPLNARRSFVEQRVRWQVRVTGQHIPVEQPGVATEAEAALDLLIYR